jgi:outer membrane biosynthesis protein TonB
MHARQISLGIAAVVAAFLIAFAIGKAANGSEATGAPARAESIDVGEAAISSNVATGARLPALKREHKRKAKKARKDSPRSPEPKPGPTPGPNPEPTARPQPAPTVAPNPNPGPNPKPKPKPRPVPTVIDGGDN